MGLGVRCGCVLGLLVSFYALWVEVQHYKDSSYQAYCDLGAYLSCSKVLTSKYSKGFGVVGPVLGESSPLNLPNCVYGLMYYVLYMCLDLMPQSDNIIKTKFSLSVSSIFMCLYLAYILAFILVDLCVVCFATYLINIGLAVPAMRNYFRMMNRDEPTPRAKKVKKIS